MVQEPLRAQRHAVAPRDLSVLHPDAFLAGILADALRNIAPRVTDRSLYAFSQMTMILIAAAVRHAITLPPKEGRRIVILFKRILPKDLSALEA